MTVQESSVAFHSNVDVLIIGAGPAGSMAVNWLAVQGVHARLVDQTSTFAIGRADGYSPRTQEILDSFGLMGRFVEEGTHAVGAVSWKPDPNQPGKMNRTEMQMSEGNDSRFLRVQMLAQGVGEEEMQRNALRQGEEKVRIDRGVLATKLTWDEERLDDLSSRNYPIAVHLGKLDSPDSTEVVHAKYVIGCDGAHSMVRKSIGVQLLGESTTTLWGVIDGVLDTDYPDVASIATWQSPSAGSALFIPREKGLSRLYIDLTTAFRLSGQPELRREQVTADIILEQAQKIFQPFRMSIAKEDIQWWSAYPVGQRLAERYSHPNRIFIAGDASHTHSPKEGSGMNVSIGDTFNLCWKLAHVLRGWASPSLLSTYEAERRLVADALLTLDKAVTTGLMKEGYTARTIGLLMKSYGFLTGIGQVYLPSALVGHATPAYQKSTLSPIQVKGTNGSTDTEFFEGANPAAVAMLLAPKVVDYNLVIGGRLRTDTPLIRLYDDYVVELTSAMRPDGRWRVVVFCGEVQRDGQMERLRELARHIETVQHKFTPQRLDQVADLRGHKDEVDRDSVIDTLVISRASLSQRRPDEYPAVFRPMTFAAQKRWGTPPNGRRVRPMLDQSKLYLDAPLENAHLVGHGDAYKRFGVEPSADHGTVVVVRPDGYISLLCTLMEGNVVEDFFEEVLQAHA